jgi:hypothetical protein
MSPVSGLGSVSNQVSKISLRTCSEVSRRLRASTFASFQRRAPAAVAASVHNAARTPGALFAAIDTPVPNGWSTGLTLPEHHGWPDPLPHGGAGSDGLVGVLVVRGDPSGQLRACSYLVDTFCLGAKNTIGPDLIPREALPAFRDNYFAVFGAGYVEIPAALAIELVRGAVDYAAALGFTPPRHADYHKTADHLGPWTGPSRIGFGRDGTPVYVNGPNDNADTVLATLERTAGHGNYHYVLGLGPH